MASSINKKLIPIDVLRDLLSYNPDTGILSWRTSRRGCKMDRTICSTDSSGYRQIRVCGGRYQEHILVWFYVTGQWPRDEIDHINLNKIDNRFKNLREAPRRLNAANRPVRRDAKSGVKGVYQSGFYKNGDAAWIAYITVNRKQMYLGRYRSKEVAHNAYVAAAEKYFGKFARSA